MSTEGSRRIAHARAKYDEWYGRLLDAIREETSGGVSEAEAARQSKFSREYVRQIRAGTAGEAPPKHRRPSSS